MNKIEIYTNNNCKYCKELKEELNKNNIEFEEKLTSNFRDEFQSVVDLIAIPTVPVVKYENEYFAPGRDYNNVEQLINILKNFTPRIFNDSRRVLERVNTLTYHMSTAFGRLDQLLRKIETKLNTEKDEHKSTD